MKQSIEDYANESILYELLEYFVRKQEPELTKFKNDSVIFPTTGTIKNALRYLNNRYSLPESISQHIGYTLPWKFAVGDNGRILAILQENVIEIRRSKDEYSSVIGKASIPKDAFPQWRKIAWSPDGSILVLASSNGYLSFYNSLGNNIYNISPRTVSQSPDILEVGDATASIIFKKPRVQTNTWDYEFIRVSYSGLLKSFCVSSNGYSENHEFSFGTFYRNGVNAVIYSDIHNLFYVAGNNVNQNMTCTASEIGLTCWRTLNDHPYYKLSILSDNNLSLKPQFSIWDFIPMMRNRPQPIIFKSSMSPNKQLLACLHTDGTISLWSLPTLKLQNQWKLTEQPDFNACNPLGSMKFKKFPHNLSAFQPLDIGWWSDNAVIIARYSGAISVCSVNNLTNLLGTSPEFLYGHPLIVELHEGKGFLCLDCEILVTKRNRESNIEGHFSEASSDSEKEEDETKSTIMNYTKNVVQSALYTMTDIEKFQPKRKKSKVFQKTYRLLGLKSTTPEELYNRKIETEEYEEALALANTYNLDPDLVYQTQWRKSDFSVKAIQEHLSKISKRSWVLNECVSRVPDNLESAKELLNFGLRGANVETLAAIGINDDGKFTSNEIDEGWINMDETSVQLNQLQQINSILENLNLNDLQEQQKELIRFRKKLLNHLDKLKTYEILLESPNEYDRFFYEEFRRFTAFENAVKFAKDSNCRGVEVMFTYNGAKLMQHWIAIISFFPETLSPENYKKLLPECDLEGRLFLMYQHELRPKDWSERNEFIQIFNPDEDFESDSIYEQKNTLSMYRNKELTNDLLGKWYCNRAYEIEKDSGMVDNALTLINIGQSHNISGLDSLLFDLETLSNLVYEVGIEDATLACLEKLTNLKKVKLLMTDSNDKNFVATIRNMVLPFERRRKRCISVNSNEDLLHDYLVALSNEDLALPVIFFKFLKASQDSDLLDSIQDPSILALDCIYACNDLNMYEKAKEVFDTILNYSELDAGIGDAHTEKIKELEREIECLQILNKYNVRVPIHEIATIKNDLAAVRRVWIQMSDNLNMVYPRPHEKQWALLLHDIVELQGLIFSCVHILECFEICLAARLRSGVKATIQGSTVLMTTKKNEAPTLKVSYNKAVELVLEASVAYFNDAKSLTDPDIELAKACLQLISDDNSLIKQEYELIQSLRILDEFRVNILPRQVRFKEDRIKLIEDCLNSRDDGYKLKQKLLNLSKSLRIEPNNNRLREGKILELITRKAFLMTDYNVCSATLKQMMQSNYQSAWKIAMDLGSCDDYKDLHFRLQCLKFSINNGPVDLLEEAMKCVNLLQIQILNKDLEKWMSTDSSSMDDSDFDMVPRMPEIQSKEFVPKMFETSTELVKNSAQLVKQSTFGLIRSAGSTDFWKSKLKFGIDQDENDRDKNGQIGEDDNREPVQKFSCFYESLHKNCGISQLDTNYSRFSRPTDYNTELKLCQTLLRISLLSETSSYGLEVSDVNHLLLECAKHTIAEDCLLGLGYLFSLQDNYLKDEENIYESLPKTRIISQLLAYFYSLILFKKIYPNSANTYAYDPNKLIHTMSTIELAENDDEKLNLKAQINLFLSKDQGNRERNLTHNTESNNYSQKIDTGIDSELSYTDNATAIPDMDDWNNWGDDDWGDVPQLKDDNPDEGPYSENILHSEEKFATEEERYTKFGELFLNIEDKEDFDKVKKLLIGWPEFENVHFTAIDKHPTLQMLVKLIDLSTQNNTNEEESILKELKEILNSQPVREDILMEFIDQKKEDIPPEQLIYLRLCSNAPSLLREAVNIIKDTYKVLKLNSTILEEIFFKNLTGLFGTNHELYHRILEDIFVNRTMPEIEENVKVLIDELVQQRNTPHAIALLNQLEGIPPSLSTYDNCFQLLLRK